MMISAGYVCRGVKAIATNSLLDDLKQRIPSINSEDDLRNVP